MAGSYNATTRSLSKSCSPHLILVPPIEASGSVVAEVRSRAWAGWGEWRSLGRRLFKGSLLDTKQKLVLARAFYVNKVLYLAGTWPPLTAPLQRLWVDIARTALGVPRQRGSPVGPLCYPLARVCALYSWMALDGAPL